MGFALLPERLLLILERGVSQIITTVTGAEKGALADYSSRAKEEVIDVI